MELRSGEPLTESMFYVLMAFRHNALCGRDVAAWIADKTRGRVSLGPGTLYTILGRFQKEGLITETEVLGRKRTYQLTAEGLRVFQAELERLRLCVADGESEGL